MNTGTARRVVWAGTVTALLLVLGFGNQWLWKEILEQDDVGKNSGWHILNWLNTPHWVIDKSDIFENLPGKYMAGYLIGALALVATVAVVLAAATRRPGSSPFIAGWFALVAGGAVCTGLAYLIAGGSYSPGGRSDDERSLDQMLGTLAYGGGYGLLVGWIVGIACAVASGGGAAIPQHSYNSAPPSPPPPANPPGGHRY